MGRLFAFLAAVICACSVQAQTVTGGTNSFMVYLGSPQSNITSNATTTLCQLGGAPPPSTTLNCAMVLPRAASIRNLTAYTPTAQGVGQTAAVTVISAAAAGGSYSGTSVTCTMSNAGACADATHAAALTAGQAWAVNIVMSTTATAAIYMVAVEVVMP